MDNEAFTPEEAKAQEDRKRRVGMIEDETLCRISQKQALYTLQSPLEDSGVIHGGPREPIARHRAVSVAARNASNWAEARLLQSRQSLDFWQIAHRGGCGRCLIRSQPCN